MPVCFSPPPGRFYYEKFEIPLSPPPTCYASCLMSNITCQGCGRPNCWGDDCQYCAKTCWERIDKSQNRTTLFKNNQRNVHLVTCNDNWQLWWNGKQTPPSLTPDELLLLHLAVIYEDGRTLNAYFDSVVVAAGGALSVGNLTSDDGAGNWWEAPFSGRSLRSFPDTNCHDFYTPNTTCVSRTTPSAEQQMLDYNGTIHRGYPWLTGDDSYDNVSISHIYFWVKCAQC